MSHFYEINHESTSLSGKRIAVFGLHIFNLDKIDEYVKTGKSDYVIVPIIGEILSHIFFIKHIFVKQIPADIKTPKNFFLTEGEEETHDFAMAILEREITFTDSIRPICIPKQVRMLALFFAKTEKIT